MLRVPRIEIIRTPQFSWLSRPELLDRLTVRTSATATHAISPNTVTMNTGANHHQPKLPAVHQHIFFSFLQPSLGLRAALPLPYVTELRLIHGDVFL